MTLPNFMWGFICCMSAPVPGKGMCRYLITGICSHNLVELARDMYLALPTFTST